MRPVEHVSRYRGLYELIVEQAKSLQDQLPPPRGMDRHS